MFRSGHLLLLLGAVLACAPKPASERGGFCSVGSAEFNMLLDHWSAGFQSAGGPMLRHEGRGNGVGPGALLDGVCDLAPMSRPMTDAEVHRFVERFGGEPLAVPVAVDALAIVVPKNFSITTITPDDVFHVFHLGPAQVRALEQDAQAAGELRVYGVNSASERFSWFKDVALHGEKFSDRTIEVADPLRLVSQLGRTGGVGYARLAEMDANLKALKIDMGFGKIVELTPATARSGLYPFTRFFYLYLPPTGRPPRPETSAFIEYVLSPAGQKILDSNGLFSLDRKEQIYNANRLEKYRQALSAP